MADAAHDAPQGTRQLAVAAVAEAGAMSVPVTVVIVDESAVLKKMCRMDGG